jgi:hypothetical protein
MMAVIEADSRLLQLLLAQEVLRQQKRIKLADSKRLVERALATAMNAHKCNGATSAQIAELERLTDKVKELHG